MRQIRNPQEMFGEIRIEDIRLDLKSRDDIPALLIGLQFLYSDEAFRERLFALLDRYILPGVSRKVGRPGMEMWRILVMGVVKQGLGCDYDRLHELVNQHLTLRQFLGHPKAWDEYQYEMQNVVDNVSLMSPELLAHVNQLIVESGHAVARKKPGAPLAGRADSFVVKTDVHYPTDAGLLWDAMRGLIRDTGRATTATGVPGWRQWKHQSRRLRSLYNAVRRTRRAKPGDVEAYLDCCRRLIGRVEGTLPALEQKGIDTGGIREYLAHAVRQTDQTRRRLLEGEQIPHHDKVFSVFEPHTRWIAKGKAGCPVELGVPVCILEDSHGFVLHHEVMWEGGDTDHAVPMVAAAQERFPELRAVSFDRGFHSPENRVRLDEMLDHNVLPKKGYRGRDERAREAGSEFVAMRRAHPAVESAINNLGHRGLDRIRARGPAGFARSVALAVVAMNIHRIGLLLRRRASHRLKHRLAA